MTITSFSDAEAGEDGGEDFGGGDVAGDGGKMGYGLAQRLGYQIGRDGAVEAVGDSFDGLKGIGKGCVVACVGDEDVAAGG